LPCQLILGRRKLPVYMCRQLRRCEWGLSN
jgi:hypothetical protein